MYTDDDDDDDNLISMEAKQCSSAGSIGVCFDVKLQSREPTRTLRSTPTVGPLLSVPLLKLAPTFR